MKYYISILETVIKKRYNAIMTIIQFNSLLYIGTYIIPRVDIFNINRPTTLRNIIIVYHVTHRCGNYYKMCVLLDKHTVANSTTSD